MSTPKEDWKTYRRLFAYVWKYKVRLLLAFILLSAASLVQAAISGVIYITVNGMVDREVVTFSGIPNIPASLAEISFSVSWIPYIIVATFLVRGFVDYFAKYLMASTGLRSIMDIRNDLFKRLSYMSCEYYSKQQSGDLISRIVNDVQSVNSAVTSTISDLIKSPLTILWSIPVIFILGGKLSLFCVGIFPLVVVPIILLGKQIRKVGKKMMEKNADITSFLGEFFSGIRVVKAFSMEAREIEGFNKISRAIYNFNKKNIRLIEIQRPLIECMGAVGIALTIATAIRVLEVDRFMAFAAALFLLYEPFKKLSKINNVVQMALASGNRIFEVMDQPIRIHETESPVEMPSEVKSITYDNVRFEYNSGEEVLKGISLDVNKGEVIALVGSSGAGKTTVVNLLLRFYDVTSGSVQFNGIDIRKFSLDDLRGKIGLVTQETILFNTTVAENISFGDRNASEEAIIEAAKAAHAHEFIQDLPEGYHTVVGERGMSLSGGQRQRISIARAIYKDPPILVFDEATSQLDTESEREVQKAIEALVRGRTVFVIAHRLSTIRNANKIIVLDEGQIIQEGTHDELLDRGGIYKKLYDLQFS